MQFGPDLFCVRDYGAGEVECRWLRGKTSIESACSVDMNGAKNFSLCNLADKFVVFTGGDQGSETKKNAFRYAIASD